MKITTRAICAGLFAVLFLGIAWATPTMAARTFSSGDVLTGKYEGELLGAAGTSGDPGGGENGVALPSAPVRFEQVSSISEAGALSAREVRTASKRVRWIGIFANFEAVFARITLFVLQR